ncbi:Avt2 [Kluyveromyces lactis]|nr:Avt2 [Kluyveromyces lactis]
MQIAADKKYAKLALSDKQSNNEPNPFELELTSFDDTAKIAGSAVDQNIFNVNEEDPLTDDIYLSNEAKSNRYMAFMNMANSILGSGVIGQPFAMKNCGIIGGLFATILMSILVDWTIRLIVINLKLTGKSTYQASVEAAMGKWGGLLILVSNGLFAFGGCVGFCIIIGDSIPHVLSAFFPSHTDLFHRNVIITLVTLFISFPLSLNRDISKLSKTSMLALLGLIAIVIIIVVKAPLVNGEYKGTFHLHQLFITPRIFQGISVISFALVCHHNTSFIFFSLRNPSLKRFNQLTHVSLILSCIVCLTTAYSGFLNFKDKTEGNILNNFPSDDNVINFARLLLGFNMLTTFPLEIFVLRDVIRDIIYYNKDDPEPVKLTTKMHALITSGLVLIIMCIALSTSNLGALLEIIGATSASLMAYILPPLTNLVITGKKKSLKEKLPYYGCIVFGVILMFVSTAQTILEAFA